MSYDITIHAVAAEELDRLRVYDHRASLDTIEEQLRHQPTVRTRRRKDLPNLAPGFEHVPPVWQLRVGDFRVIHELAREVHVRAVRRKGLEQTTGDIT